MATGKWFSILLNPHRDNLTMYRADYVSGTGIVVMSLDGEHVGQGYFEQGSGDNQAPARCTGYPRVHTPRGVINEGGGFGTVLYTALCHAAYLENQGKLSPRIGNVSGAGISSASSTRSSDADRWWTAAREKYDLAEQADCTSESESDEEDTTDFSCPDLYRGWKYDVCDALARQYDWNIDHVQLTVTGTSTSEESDGEADFYTYSSAKAANLIVARVEIAEYDAETGLHDLGAVHKVFPGALGAVNYRRFFENYFTDNNTYINDEDEDGETLVHGHEHVDQPYTVIQALSKVQDKLHEMGELAFSDGADMDTFRTLVWDGLNHFLVTYGAHAGIVPSDFNPLSGAFGNVREPSPSDVRKALKAQEKLRRAAGLDKFSDSY